MMRAILILLVLVLAAPAHAETPLAQLQRVLWPHAVKKPVPLPKPAPARDAHRRGPR